MLSTVLFTLCVLAGLGYFAWQMWGRIGLLLAAEGRITVDRVPERLWAVLVYFFGQKKFVRPEVGIVRGGQVITMFGRAYSDDFYPPLLGPNLLGGPYMLVRDLFEAIVVGCVVVALVRWGITHPARLFGYAPAENRQRSHAHWEAYLILCFIGLIGLGGLTYDAGRIVERAHDPEMARM